MTGARKSDSNDSSYGNESTQMEGDTEMLDRPPTPIPTKIYRKYKAVEHGLNRTRIVNVRKIDHAANISAQSNNSEEQTEHGYPVISRGTPLYRRQYELYVVHRRSIRSRRLGVSQRATFLKMKNERKSQKEQQKQRRVQRLQELEAEHSSGTRSESGTMLRLVKNIIVPSWASENPSNVQPGQPTKEEAWRYEQQSSWSKKDLPNVPGFSEQARQEDNPAKGNCFWYALANALRPAGEMLPGCSDHEQEVRSLKDQCTYMRNLVIGENANPSTVAFWQRRLVYQAIELLNSDITPRSQEAKKKGLQGLRGIDVLLNTELPEFSQTAVFQIVADVLDIELFVFGQEEGIEQNTRRDARQCAPRIVLQSVHGNHVPADPNRQVFLMHWMSLVHFTTIKRPGYLYTAHLNRGHFKRRCPMFRSGFPCHPPPLNRSFPGALAHQLNAIAMGTIDAHWTQEDTANAEGWGADEREKSPDLLQTEAQYLADVHTAQEELRQAQVNREHQAQGSSMET